MKTTVTIAVLLLFIFSIAGCDDTPENGGAAGTGGSDDDTGSGADGDPCPNGVTATDDDGNLVIIANAEQNYRFESTLAAETIAVRSLTDIVFDWSDITIDMLGRPFDPLTSVDMMEVMLWQYGKDDLLRDINDDDLDRGNLMAIGYIDTLNEMTSGNFLGVASPGGSAQPPEVLLDYVDTSLYPTDSNTYLVMVAEGSVYGQGTKMLAFFEPDPDETNTEVRLSNESTTLTYTVELTSRTPIAIPAGNPDVVLDWIDDDLALGTNAMGAEWVPNRITDVMIAHYADKTLDDLEDDFLNIELIADEIWRIFLSAGQSVNFSLLINEAGEAFAGIDDTGVWIVGLICSSCTNPAPWYLAALEACPSSD